MEKIMRNTIQRDLVLETAKVLDHPTADEVYQSIQKNHPAISKATVYRNLNFLAGCGALKRIEIANDADHFDLTCINHYHFHCQRCGGIKDLPIPYMDALNDQVVRLSGLLIEDHTIVFNGHCPDCQN